MAYPKVHDPALGEFLSEEQNHRAANLGIIGWKDALDEIERQRKFIQRWHIEQEAKHPLPLHQPKG